jgi:hypothetical protein
MESQGPDDGQHRATPSGAASPIDRTGDGGVILVVVARAFALVAPLPAGLGLWIASRLYTDTYTCATTHCSGGGLGRIGIGIALVGAVDCGGVLVGGVALFALIRALLRRQWAWATGLALITAVGIAGIAGAASDLSHRILVAVLGAGPVWIWPWVVASAALLLVALAGIAYTFLGQRSTPPA